jgi:hypothetical protein
MKQSENLNQKYQDLRNRIVAEIMLLVKKHIFDHEVAVEFQKPIFYGTGHDEQDNAPEIEEVTDSGLVIIYYQGSETERFPLEQLDTEKLIEVLEGLELSFEELKNN